MRNVMRKVIVNLVNENKWEINLDDFSMMIVLTGEKDVKDTFSSSVNELFVKVTNHFFGEESERVQFLLNRFDYLIEDAKYNNLNDLTVITKGGGKELRLNSFDDESLKHFVGEIYSSQKGWDSETAIEKFKLAIENSPIKDKIYQSGVFNLLEEFKKITVINFNEEVESLYFRINSTDFFFFQGGISISNKYSELSFEMYTLDYLYTVVNKIRSFILGNVNYLTGSTDKMPDVFKIAEDDTPIRIDSLFYEQKLLLKKLGKDADWNLIESQANELLDLIKELKSQA